LVTSPPKFEALKHSKATLRLSRLGVIGTIFCAASSACIVVSGSGFRVEDVGLRVSGLVSFRSFRF